MSRTVASMAPPVPAIPSGWCWSEFGPWIARIEAGKSFKCEERPPLPEEVGVIKVSAVTWGTFRPEESKTCTDPKLIRPAWYVQAGDFLFSRANTIELVGACVVVDGLTHSALMLSDKILRLSFFAGEPKWYLWALRSLWGRAEIQRLATGNQESMRNIGQERIAQIRLPIAPAREQADVVSYIETQVSRLDAAVAGLKRVQANLKRYRASVLKAAVEGRLVPTEAELAKAEDRRFEPASELLARILKERRARWEAAELASMKAKGKPPKDEKWKARYKEPAAPDTKGLPELSEGWCWATVEQLSTLVTKGSSPKWQGFAYQDSGVLFVRSQNVGWGGLLLEQRAYLDEAFNAKEAKSVVQKHDVLLNIVGASIGRAAVATEVLQGANTNQAVAIIRLIPDAALPAFVCYQLISPAAQAHISKTKVDVARANLSLADVAAMVLALPPRAEQIRIAAALERYWSHADSTASGVVQDVQRCARLRQAILKWAFEGRLVDQDPNDEPASVLLERIRAEREAPRRLEPTSTKKSKERLAANASRKPRPRGKVSAA